MLEGVEPFGANCWEMTRVLAAVPVLCSLTDALLILTCRRESNHSALTAGRWRVCWRAGPRQGLNSQRTSIRWRRGSTTPALSQRAAASGKKPSTRCGVGGPGGLYHACFVTKGCSIGQETINKVRGDGRENESGWGTVGSHRCLADDPQGAVVWWYLGRQRGGNGMHGGCVHFLPD